MRLTKEQGVLLNDAFSVIMEMHETTRFKEYKTNDDKIKQMIAHFIVNGFVRLKNGSLMIGKTYSPWFADDLFASDVLIYTKKDSRGRGEAKAALLDFVSWAKDKGAISISIGQSSGVSKKEFEQLAGSLNMIKIGTTYHV